MSAPHSDSNAATALPPDELLRALFGSNDENVIIEYSSLRARLLRYFAARRSMYPEGLADEVISRAVRQVSGGATVPNLCQYCYGIAANVLSESRRKRREDELPASMPADPWSSPLSLNAVEQRMTVEKALGTLVQAERALLCEYYLEDRKALAGKLGISANALRLRVFRILGEIRDNFKMKGAG
jgi:DNA-directed RNA polymerase specialized sigma24 family protein